jgi:hypothetical protein
LVVMLVVMTMSTGMTAGVPVMRNNVALVRYLGTVLVGLGGEKISYLRSVVYFSAGIWSKVNNSMCPSNPA